MGEVNNTSPEPPHSLSREDKLKWLMQAYGNDVIRIAYAYLKERQLAEDVAQDVFIKCYEKMETFRNESSYKTWMIKITVNRCKDVLKSWSYKNLLLTNQFNHKKADVSVEQDYFKDKDSQNLSQQVMDLPVKLREVIFLYYYQDFSIGEISDLLKINENTIKTRLYRARNKLKEALEMEGSKQWKKN